MRYYLLRRRLVKIMITIGIVFLILYILPIPSVGEPVKNIALPDSRFLMVNNVLVHYVEYGTGETLFVLLHGFGASTFTWRELIPSLAQLGRVIAFDRPGFGLTERAHPSTGQINPYHVDGVLELTCNFIKSTYKGESRVFVIGHSAGGGLALLLALRCNVELAGVIVIAPAWKPYSKSIIENILFNLPLADKYGPIIMRSFIGQLESILHKAWYNKSKLTPEIIEGYKYPLKARDWDKGLYWIMKYREFPDIRGELVNIRIPILIIHGLQDEIVPVNSSLELYEVLSSYTLVHIVTIDQCGHLPHEEESGIVIDEISEFIESLQ